MKNHSAGKRAVIRSLKTLLPTALAVIVLTTTATAQNGSVPVQLLPPLPMEADHPLAHPGDGLPAGGDAAAYCGSAESCGCCDRCVAKIETVKEERSCWNVSCDKVCIPAIRSPWELGGSPLTLFRWPFRKHQNCGCPQCAANRPAAGPESLLCECVPRCGSSRGVSVLKSEKYEVTECRCKWEIQSAPPCDANCGPPAGAAATADDQSFLANRFSSLIKLGD
jgi:hypothetical protein